MSVDSKEAKSNIQQLQKLPDPAPKKRRGRPPLSADAKLARKRLNALMHGVDSNIPIIPDMEREEDYIRHRDGVMEGLDPQGYLEEHLAERVAIILWKLKRVTRYEIAVTMLNINSAFVDLAVADAYAAGNLASGQLEPPSQDELQEYRETRILPPPEQAERIERLEKSLSRMWERTVIQLQALQDRRRGAAAPAFRMSVS